MRKVCRLRANLRQSPLRGGGRARQRRAPSQIRYADRRVGGTPSRRRRPRVMSAYPRPPARRRCHVAATTMTTTTERRTPPRRRAARPRAGRADQSTCQIRKVCESARACRPATSVEGLPNGSCLDGQNLTHDLTRSLAHLFVGSVGSIGFAKTYAAVIALSSTFANFAVRVDTSPGAHAARRVAE